MYEGPVQDLIDELGRLPGVGPKSAQRIAFHLLDADEATIQETIDRFKELGVQQIGLSHCTGPKATAMFQEQMPEQTFLNTTGSVYTVE